MSLFPTTKLEQTQKWLRFPSIGHPHNFQLLHSFWQDLKVNAEAESLQLAKIYYMLSGDLYKTEL